MTTFIMELIKFDESMCVNIDKIDEQHRGIFDILNKLSNAIQKREANAILREILAGLSAYANYHFSIEEELFQKYNYPKVNKHISEHKYYIDKIDDFNRRFKQSNNLVLSVDIVKFLVDWITNHIKIEDKEYAEFFDKKGIIPY